MYNKHMKDKHTFIRCEDCERESAFHTNDGYYCEDHVEIALLYQEIMSNIERLSQRNAISSEWEPHEFPHCKAP